MKRKLKVKLLRLFKKESGAHIRARIKRDLRKIGGQFRALKMFTQGEGNFD